MAVEPEDAEIHILEDEASSREYIKQLWAEVLLIYKSGNYSMKFSKEIRKQLLGIQREFMPDDTAAGMIQDFLDDYSGDKVCVMMLFKEALHMLSGFVVRICCWFQLRSLKVPSIQIRT